MNEKDVGCLELVHNFSVTLIATSFSWKCTIILHANYCAIFSMLHLPFADGEPHDGSIGRVTDTLSKAVTTVLVILGIIGIVFAAVCVLLNTLLRKKP